ncbi:MAG: efflux RND transporter periplasmic adaptor subunit [Acidobacteria bacterium]|nr:MAG: efflux RND transporter periplasmic adaptor subunit [Acidobacteriota bacterium]MCE7960561.1 efflux RND transporter periplasmic adaptor subunit [Acidobacteria bacterium ACB2]
MSRRGLRIALAVAAVAAAAVLLRFTLLAPKPVPVSVVAAARGRVEETASNSKAGTVESRRHATLSPEVGGRLAEKRVREGQRVRKGDVLLRLADADLVAQVSLQERTVAASRAAEREACTSAELARKERDRTRSLFDGGVASQGLLDQAETRLFAGDAACEAARARVGQAAAALEVARVTLAKMVLRAPFDGVVADVTAEEGEWVMPSPPALPVPPVVEMFDPEALYVKVPLDEVDVGRVKPSQPVRVTFDAFPGKSFQGRVTQVAPAVEDRLEQNRTFDVEVELDDAAFARTLSPGTSVDVEVVLGARDGVLRIPRTSLLEGDRVLVLSDGRLSERKLETGLVSWEWVEVVKGLSEGERVVVSLDRTDVKPGVRARAAEAP